MTREDFAVLVTKMRMAQKRYFELMARAKKSKHPDDFSTARKILEMSKALEKQVDEEADSILKAAAAPKETVPSAPFQVEPLTE
jgi:hypothetical protein